MNEPLYLIAGVSPGMDVGGTSYVNTDLAGRLFELERVDDGTMYPDTSDATIPDYHVRGTGGFDLLIAGQQFGDAEKFVLRVLSTATQPVTGTPRYTNGFDLTQVLSSLRKRLGWRQPTVSGSPVINADNLTSVSGRYFQSFHSLVTIANLQNVQENKDADDTEFNTYLANLQDDAIMRCLNEVFREPELIEQRLMYTRFGQMDQVVNNSGQFVGYIINTANDEHISTQINLATLYFDQDCSFNLYLFMDGIKAPLQQIPVNCVAYQRTEIDFDSLVLNYKIGQRYYFGYFQNELGSARAIREQVNTWATTKCFEAYCFYAPATDSNTDFNHNYRQYPFLPQGLNLELISFRDHTQKILRKANLFDECVGLQVAVMVTEEIMMSTRTNKDQRIVGENAKQLFQELNQSFSTEEVPFMPGLKARVQAELKRIYRTFFPEEKAQSMSMQGDTWGIEGSWYKQNYRQITNPPAQILGSGGGPI